MPTQDRIRCEQRAEFFQSFAAQNLAFESKSASLVIVEQDPLHAQLLFEHRGRVVSREEVVSAVWAEDESEGVSEQAIDALARRLRERIAEADPDYQYVMTVRGHGFRLEHAAE